MKAVVMLSGGVGMSAPCGDVIGGRSHGPVSRGMPTPTTLAREAGLRADTLCLTTQSRGRTGAGGVTGRGNHV